MYKQLQINFDDPSSEVGRRHPLNGHESETDCFPISLSHNANYYSQFNSGISGRPLKNQHFNTLKTEKFLEFGISSSELSLLERDYSQYYFIDVKKGSSTDHRTRVILDEEGCPVCLLGIEGIEENDPLVIFTCRLANCAHVLHYACVRQMYLGGEANPASKLNSFHSGLYFTVRRFVDSSMVDTDKLEPFKYYQISIEVTHLISNISSMKIEWPDPIPSFKDPQTGKQFLLVTLKGLENNEASEQNLPMFRAKRGKITFQCTDTENNFSWHHECNYSAYIDEDKFLFVMPDAHYGNDLTLGVQKEQVSPSMQAYSLIFLRYEIEEEKPKTPKITLTPTFGSASIENNSMGSYMNYINSSPLINNVSPYFMQEDYKSLFYKLPENSEVVEEIENAKNKKISEKIVHGGTVFDYYPLQTEYGKSFTLPKSPKPSVIEKKQPYASDMSENKMAYNEALLSKDYSSKVNHKSNRSFSADTKGSRISRKNKISNCKIERMNKRKPSEINNLIYSISMGEVINKPLNKIILQLDKDMLSLSKNQLGSRFIQENLANPEYFLYFYNSLVHHSADMMIDSFGHYAFEALFDKSNREQKQKILENLRGHVETVACHKQGSFSMQSLMEEMFDDSVVDTFIEILKPHVRKLSVSCSGHYVILRFIARFKIQKSRFIVDEIASDCLHYTTDHYGLRVVKSLLEQRSHSETSIIIASVVRNTHRIVQNQFGNYVVQHILEQGSERAKEELKMKMVGKYVNYAKQKFSSNVVEKCIKSSEPEWKRRIISELITMPANLINDKYGNYCLQTALNECEQDMVKEFSDAITPHLKRLRENVRMKWHKLLERANLKSGTNISN